MRPNTKYRLRAIALITVFFIATNAQAQSPFNGFGHLFTTPKNYITRFTASAPMVDGKLNDKAWEAAAWSDNFEDIEGDNKPLPALQTRMKMLWNDSCLFIAAELKEPHVWATLRQHDEIVFHDNDFEVFIDPDNNTHDYYEIEINALNTIFDLLMPKAYRNGGNAMINWDQAKLRSGIAVRGTLNRSSDKDESWTVEMAMPFHSLSFNSAKNPPKEGEIWRINFSRVEWDTEIMDGKYVKVKDSSGRNKPEHNWVWSPQGVINMHFPERWGYLQFTRQAASSTPVIFEMPYVEKQKNYLWFCYYKQKEYSARNRRYAASLSDLVIDSTVTVDNHPNKIKMEATSGQFMATIVDDNSNTVSINDEGLIRYSRDR